MRKPKKVITYGTFDLLHYGHINLLKRARELGDFLIVGLSTDEFNTRKRKDAFLSYAQRKVVLEAIRYVDQVIPEKNWKQKVHDIRKHDVDVFVMGSDWKGEFDNLKSDCKVVYLPRTSRISSRGIKSRVYNRL